jgi:hypothetical protein
MDLNIFCLFIIYLFYIVKAVTSPHASVCSVTPPSALCPPFCVLVKDGCLLRDQRLHGKYQEKSSE